MCYCRKYATFLLVINNGNLSWSGILNLSTNSIAASIRPQNSIYKNAKYAILRDHLLQYQQLILNKLAEIRHNEFQKGWRKHGTEKD